MILQGFVARSGVEMPLTPRVWGTYGGAVRPRNITSELTSIRRVSTQHILCLGPQVIANATYFRAKSEKTVRGSKMIDVNGFGAKMIDFGPPLSDLGGVKWTYRSRQTDSEGVLSHFPW